MEETIDCQKLLDDIIEYEAKLKDAFESNQYKDDIEMTRQIFDWLQSIHNYCCKYTVTDAEGKIKTDLTGALKYITPDLWSWTTDYWEDICLIYKRYLFTLIYCIPIGRFIEVYNTTKTFSQNIQGALRFVQDNWSKFKGKEYLIDELMSRTINISFADIIHDEDDTKFIDEIKDNISRLMDFNDEDNTKFMEKFKDDASGLMNFTEKIEYKFIEELNDNALHLRNFANGDITLSDFENIETESDYSTALLFALSNFYWKSSTFFLSRYRLFKKEDRTIEGKLYNDFISRPEVAECLEWADEFYDSTNPCTPILSQDTKGQTNDLLPSTPEEILCKGLDNPNGFYETTLAELSEVFAPGVHIEQLYYPNATTKLPLTWKGKWNKLSYLIRILYCGMVKDSRIVSNNQVPKNVWGNMRQYFAKEDGSQAKSLKTVPWDKLQSEYGPVLDYKIIPILQKAHREVQTN